MSTFVEAPLVLQEQLQGKVDQLSVDPQKVCRTPKVSKPASSSTGEEESRSFLSTVPTYVVTLFAAAASLMVVLLCYVCYSSRKAARDAAYNLVPIDDADAGQGLLKHDEGQS